MKDVNEEDRVLHGDGDPAAPDPTDATTFDFNDMAQRRARALAELDDGEEMAEEAVDDAPSGEEGTPHVEPTEEEGDDSGSFESDEEVAEVGAGDASRRHKAEIAEMQDRHQRQMESLMRSMGPYQSSPPEEDVAPPDPDLDPGAYVEHKLRPLEDKLNQMNQETAQQEQVRRLEMVQSYLDEKMSDHEVFASKPNLTEDVRSAIMYQLFNDENTTVENWEQAASNKVGHFADRYAKEFQNGATKADKVSRQLASNRAAKAVKSSRDSGTPVPLRDDEPPDFDFGDHDQRKERALMELDDIFTSEETS